MNTDDSRSPAVTLTVSQPSVLPGDRRRRRRWPIILACLAALLAIPLGFYFFVMWSDRSDLEAAIAETDALDPRWRWSDLLADRTPIPDEQNPALVALKAHALTGTGFDVGPKNYPLFEGDMPPQHRLNGQQIAVLREALRKHAEAVDVARTLKDFTGEGRFPIKYTPDYISINLDPLQRNRLVMSMLMYDAMFRAEEEDTAGALESCRALLASARSIGDEPFLIAALVRVAGGLLAVETLERVLAQGEPPADELKAMQELLAREIDAPILYQAMRGERAGDDSLIATLSAGNTNLGTLIGGPTSRRSLSWNEWLADMFPALLARGRPEFLRLMNKAVEASKLSSDKQGEALDEVEAEVRASKAPLVRLLFPSITNVAKADARKQARLRCALAGVAAERYRLKHQQWPRALEDLVTEKLLDKVPLDPFDGQPLRYKAMADGILIYTVGYDRVDNGGLIARGNPLQPGTDIGFRLWDVAARRQAPLPPPPADEAAGPP